MPPRRRLSAVDRGRALSWIHDGVCMREVARRLAVSHSVIQRLRDRFETTGRAEERPRPGRPRITSRQDDRFVCLAALRNRSLTSNDLRGQLRMAANVRVSDQMIRNRLHEASLHSRRPAVRTPLTQAHRRARVEWCRRHLRWTRQQWSRVLFTDESCFTLSHPDGRVRVWGRQGERFIDGTVQERNRYGGGSVMVWGGFHLQGRTPLHLAHGILTGVHYRNEILQPIAIPVLRAMGVRSTLQDDNATPHRACIVTNFLGQQGVQRMQWPANSPDLAPIEHLLDVRGRRVRDNHPLPEMWLSLVSYSCRNG
ncbi:hypothetical protein V1264_010117 [Littorina saxatilis]|uniref:Transposase n=1 Tax=Littorina saxatilis TaxID=31220 RepID=A0AAN9G0H4_9CAEN